MSPAEAAARDFRARVSVGGQAAVGPGAIRVDATGIDCAAGPAGPLRVEHDEIAALERGDLTVTLRLGDGTVVGFDKGGSLDDLWDVLRAAFRARVSESLRFAPTDPRHTFDARVTLDGPGGFAALPAQVAVVRLGLNYLADRGPCAQLPFGALGEPAFRESPYEVALPVGAGAGAPGGATLRIAGLARRTDEFLAVLRQAREASLTDTARCLAAFLPKTAAAQRTALAAEMLVGRMVSRERCEAVAPGAWEILWAAAAGPARAPYRDALESLAAGPGSLFMGMRPYGGVPQDEGGATADACDEDTAASRENGGGTAPDSTLPVVYAAALLRGASAAPARLALEVLSERDHATYVYRTEPVPAGATAADTGAWLAAVVSHTLLSLDFKKEPLYLPEPELLQARDGLYRAALRRLPGLREMRSRLAGRAAHTSLAAWKSQMDRLG